MCMAIDHSKTYKATSVKNIVHIHRLREIKRTLKASVTQPVEHYGDFGCSNGYVTNEIAALLGAKSVVGLDWSDNLVVGSKLYPWIRFEHLDLNVFAGYSKCFDVVTCFETMEHVGDMKTAVQNLLSSCKDGGLIIISVPIEIGVIGLVKYFVKRLVFRYEFPLVNSEKDYVLELIKGGRISKHRARQSSYGSHFGFDYRDLDDIVGGVRCSQSRIWNSGTTRFYLINGVNTRKA
jgi:2-polyprenyl-3-methyl-5-hydroxy-6-metoxy-1,4-benzoquinol methylase